MPFIKRCLPVLVPCLLMASRAFGQEWGDLSVAESLVDWVLNNVLIIVVTLALIGVLVYAIYERNIMIGIVGFAIVVIIGGIASVIPDIAQTTVGG